MVRTRRSALYDRIVFNLWRGLRRLYLAGLGDPLVAYRFEGTRLLVPLSHDLPIIRKWFPYYATNLTRVARRVHEKYQDMSAIDIGANVGDSIVLLRKAGTFPILAIDGDERFFEILKENAVAWEAVMPVHAIVAGATGHRAGAMRRDAGSARVISTAVGVGGIAAMSLASILAEHPVFSRVKLVKVDTDGFDCDIVQGAADLLNRERPVLFFEYDPYLFGTVHNDGFQVFGFLRNFGYKRVLVFDNTGEYVIGTELANVSQLEDLHQFYSGRGGLRYCDLCVFHTDDDDLSELVRKDEIEYFGKVRRGEAPLERSE